MAGEFVREEMHHIREGKHGARSTKQAIAIGLSKARRAGVRLAVGLLAGCSTQQRFVYDKPGAVASDARRDENEWLRSALTQDTSGRFLTLMQIDRDAYAHCMRSRGYTARPVR